MIAAELDSLGMLGLEWRQWSCGAMDLDRFDTSVMTEWQGSRVVRCSCGVLFPIQNLTCPTCEHPNAFLAFADSTKQVRWQCKSCRFISETEELVCPRCSQLDDGATKCSGCGTVFRASDSNCPHCHALNRLLTVECTQCGVFMAKSRATCPHCGALNKSSFQECPGCKRAFLLEAVNCPYCGGLSTKFWRCPNCKTTNANSLTRCSHCGFRNEMPSVIGADSIVGSGSIYILANLSMPGLVKIGMTERSVQERAAELYSTAVPTEFEIKLQCPVRDARAAEQELMRILEAHRCTEVREFFRVPLEVAIRHAVAVCAKYSI